MSDSTICFLVLGAVVALFVWNRLPVELVAVGAGLSLYATGILEINQVLAGFGDSTVIFIACLFVVSEGLDASGVTALAGQFLVAHAGESRNRLLVLVMIMVAGLTALISVNGAVAALLPVVVVTAIRLGRWPSQLLLPLAFGAHAGSMLALTGTPVNVIVSDAGADAGGGRFGFFEFALVGVPLLIGTILIAVLLGPRLLPERRARTMPPDFSEHCRTLVQQYRIDGRTFRLRVGPGSPCVGLAPADLDLRPYPGVTLTATQVIADDGPDGNDPAGNDPAGDEPVGNQTTGAGAAAGGRRDALVEGDVLIVRGDAEMVRRLAAEQGLQLDQLRGAGGRNGGRNGDGDRDGNGLFSRELGVAEVVIPPRSGMIGVAIGPGMVTSSGDLVVLAVQRRGEDLGPRETVLAPGDTLLLQGTWDALDENLADPDVLVVDAPEAVRRQVLPMGPGAKRAVAVLAGMVVLLATGIVPAVVAGLLAAGAMVLLRVLTMDQVYRGISWTTVILVGGMIPLSTAMQQTGAAEKLAHWLVEAVRDSGPYALLVGLFILTAALGQLISNMATALIVIPIAVSAAAEISVSPRPVLMAVNVAAAAALLTPVATPVNLMVMGPAGYRFSDYWKLGLVTMVLFFVVATFLVPLYWSF